MESYIEIPKNVNNNNNINCACYELMSIIDTRCQNIDFEIEKIENKINQITNRISCNVEKLGIKKLAYEIRGQKDGCYVDYTFIGVSKDIEKIEKYLKNNDSILKFIIVKKEGDEM